MGMKVNWMTGVVIFFLALLFFGMMVHGNEEGLPSFHKEDFLEDLIDSPSLEECEEFKALGYLSDEVLIEMKIDLTNHKRSVLTEAAEIILKYLPLEPPKDKQVELQKMSKIVQRCSDLEDNIWLIIKIRRLHDQKEREDRLAVKPPPSIQ